MNEKGQVHVNWGPLQSGSVSRKFHKVLQTASNSVLAKKMKSMSWNMWKTVKFDDNLLAGKHCEFESIPLSTSYSKLRTYIRSDLKYCAKDSLGGERQSISKIRISTKDEFFSIILLPVYGIYENSQNPASSQAIAVVSGQNGTVIADKHPIAEKKIKLWVFASFLTFIIGAIFLWLKVDNNQGSIEVTKGRCFYAQSAKEIHIWLPIKEGGYQKIPLSNENLVLKNQATGKIHQSHLIEDPLNAALDVTLTKNGQIKLITFTSLNSISNSNTVLEFKCVKRKA